MRLLHYSVDGGPIRVGVMDGGGQLRDLEGTLRRANPGVAAIPQSLDSLLQEGVLDALLPGNSSPVDSPPVPGLDEVVAAGYRVHQPLLRPGKIIGVGTNYQDHAEEAGVNLPEEPVFFAKYNNTLIGPYDPIRMPAVEADVDWEGELVVVLGKGGRDITEVSAMSHVAGYAVGNDVTARDWQLRKPLRQWTLGKSFDTFLPIGPMLVTADEVPEPYNLRIKCEVSGQLMQDALTAMHFKIPHLIAYLSRVLTFEPGDIILTGTPAGVGMGRKPPRYLEPGDVVVTSIDGLGEMRNRVEGESRARRGGQS